MKEKNPTGDSLMHEVGPSVVDVLYFVTKNRAWILYFPVVVACVVALITLALPNVYTATARILPPQQDQSMAAAFLGALPGIEATAGAALGIKNPSDLYIGILQSRSIADKLISRFQLKSKLEEETMVETRKALAKLTTISAGKDGLIAIEVDNPDPQLAAQMANAYVEELDSLIQGLAIGEAGQRRLYLERQLQLAKEELNLAEAALLKTQEKTGLIRMDEQGKAIIEAVAQMRAQIAAKEVQLAALRTYATPDNPEYARTVQELSGLRRELLKLEQAQSVGSPKIFVPTGKVPELGLEYIRKLRDVKYHETIFELLAKQYELAKAEEAKSAPVVQVVDRAIPPDRKSKPARTVIVLATLFIAFVLGVLVALFLQGLRRAQDDPAQNEKLKAVIGTFTRRSTA